MTLVEATSTAEFDLQALGDAVRRASSWLALECAEHGVPPPHVERLDLCLNEALANVIAHGGKAAIARPISLKLDVHGEPTAGAASVTVIDHGKEFDTTTAPLKARATSLAEAEPGGLGLFMLRSYSDTLDYCRSDDRNQLRFTVRWAQA